MLTSRLCKTILIVQLNIFIHSPTKYSSDDTGYANVCQTVVTKPTLKTSVNMKTVCYFAVRSIVVQ